MALNKYELIVKVKRFKLNTKCNISRLVQPPVLYWMLLLLKRGATIILELGFEKSRPYIVTKKNCCLQSDGQADIS